MEMSIRGALKATHHHFNHAMDIQCIQNALDTVDFFLGEVLAADHQTNGSAASSEAYDFVSAMHFGKYGVYRPSWKPDYCNMKKDSAWTTASVRNVVTALRFFDGLSAQSLSVALSHKGDLLPEKWTLSSGRKTMVFSAEYYAYESYVSLGAHIDHLLKNSNSRVELPKLFSKHAYQCAIGKIGSKKDCVELKEWILKSFKLLVKDPSTRCAAVDLLNLHPHQMTRLL